MLESWQSKLQTIIDMLESSDINEIEVSFFGRKFRVSKGSNPSQMPFQASNFVEQPSPILDRTISKEANVAQPDGGVEVIAPMVGTFYRSPSPETPPFVSEGDYISAGQVVCIIEAMKVFNEIPAEISGLIVAQLVDDEEPVEFGKPLFKVDTSK